MTTSELLHRTKELKFYGLIAHWDEIKNEETVLLKKFVD